MPLPNELHMPSLSDLDNNLRNYGLNLVLIGAGPKDETLRRLFITFIRVVDTCVAQYELARTHFQNSLPDGQNRLSSALWATDHLELCVISVRRSLNLLQSITRYPKAPVIPKMDRRALESFQNRIRDTRDTIIHIEEDILSGEISSGQSHILTLSPDGRSAVVGEHQLSLNELGTALRRIHELANKLSQFRENE